MSMRPRHGNARRAALDLRDRKGDADALGTLLAFPVWFAFTGAFVVLTWWCWTLAASQITLAKASTLDAHAAGTGADGKPDQSRAVVVKRRGVARDVERVGTIALWTYTVRLRAITRIEQFYGRPPVEDWE
jgi:hypothetical protein